MSKIVAVIGAGSGGVEAALQVADSLEIGKIILIEQSEALQQGTCSNANPRVGAGFHYPDLATAIRYLRASIKVLKKYPGFTLHDNDPRLKNWFYFVVKESKNTQKSQFSLDFTRRLYKNLQNEYRELVSKDPDNAVFGDPNNFYQEMTLEEYRKFLNVPEEEFRRIVNPDVVECVIKTAERIFNWPKFREQNINQVKKHAKIDVRTSTEVVDVRKEGAKYILVTKCNNKKSELTVDIVINASWNSIRKLDAKAGFYVEPNEYTMRTKCMIQLELPKELQNVPSMFFCFGAFASLTNTGYDVDAKCTKGFLTYEPETNIEATTHTEISEYSKNLISGKATEEEKQQFAKKIIDGAAIFMPAIKEAKFKGVIKFGVVITKGEVNIHSADSAFHNRDYSGVDSLWHGWVDLFNMKLFYLVQNGNEVKNIVDCYLNLMNIDFDKEYKLSSADSERLKFIVQQNFTKYIQSENNVSQIPETIDINDNFVNNDFAINNCSQTLFNMCKVVERKLLLNRSLPMRESPQNDNCETNYFGK